jgi:hypothetical protein
MLRLKIVDEVPWSVKAVPWVCVCGVYVWAIIIKPINGWKAVEKGKIPGTGSVKPL